MTNIVILGSTGSIGQNAVDVARRFPGRFRVLGLSTNSNIDSLKDQIREFSPSFVCVGTHQAYARLKGKVNNRCKIFFGSEGLQEMVGQGQVETVLLAIGGSAGLAPLLAAIKNKKNIALANKEALVMAGSIVMGSAKKNDVKVFPVDSEQSAIWQCLNGQDGAKLKAIYLTASGGPFRKFKKKEFKDISLSKVLRHPRWKMGRKITVDSATLMNKGLEILEAMFLFDVPADKIKVLIHPESIIHSMVEFVDGVILAQLAVTDMRIPILYALSYPERLGNGLGQIDFFKLKRLNFEKPDLVKFPCLGLAYKAARDLGTAPAVLNAANEVCVENFLQKKLPFYVIPDIIARVLSRHRNKVKPAMQDILESDAWARIEALKEIERRN